MNQRKPSMKPIASLFGHSMKQTPWNRQSARFSRLARPFAVMGLILASIATLQAQVGPFSPSNWPPSINTNSIVDYFIIDPNANFTTPASWNNVLSWDNCCDQTYTTITIGGLFGDQATSANVNIADPNYTMFANTPVIDILVQVYGNSVLYTGTNGDSVGVLEGQLNFLTTAPAGNVPQGADNSQWNWMLFEVTNSIDPATSNRYVGDTSYPPQVNGQDGGVNGGTLRIQGIGAGMTIRAVAFGPQGAFGTSNQVNVFAAGAVCAPEPAVNLAYIDFNQKLTNNLTVINDSGLGETYTNESGVGPADDLRTAIQSTSGLMNFGILSNYLGLPCNTPRTMELGIEFYDDPALAGTILGPSQFATDAGGDLAAYGGSTYTTTGTGQWLKLAFYIGGVDLEGVSTAPLTGGPTLAIQGSAPFIDRVELGVIRTGTNALAGLTPAPDYFMNPLICETNYGYYAEWAPYLGITNNLESGAPGGGDQNMVLTNAGPADDQRLSEAPAPGSGNNNLQFPLLNNVFGPSYQDNADVIIEMTYYDDPALVGATIYPQVYQSWVSGISSITFPVAPYNARAVLQGTGKWQDAYFELPNVNFNGVNQGPQSLVRFETGSVPGTNAPAVVYVSRVRYDVIRPCGPFEGIDMLQSLGITGSNTTVNLNWRGTATLQAASAVTGPFSNAVTVMNTLTNSYTPPSTNSAQFFRLQYPGYPSYLSTNPIINIP
jgi:hypothetical protein